MKTPMKLYATFLLVAGLFTSPVLNAQGCGTPGGLNVTVASSTSMQRA